MPFLFLKYCLLVGVSLPVYSLDRSGMVTQPTIENCVGAQLRRVSARTSCDFCIVPSPSQLLVGRNSHRVLHHRIIRIPKICTHK